MLAALLLLFFTRGLKKEEIYHPTMIDFRAIDFGMSEEEVEAILGPPHKVLTRKSDKSEFYRPESINQRVFLYYGSANEQKQVDVFVIKFNWAEGRVIGYGNGADFESSWVDKLVQSVKNLFGW
jgi:hypothetical protein